MFSSAFGGFKTFTHPLVKSGGYEHSFIKSTPDKYICMICHKVQREAVITSCCSKHYCKSCLENWIGRAGINCPNCRNKTFKYFLNRQQVQEINEMEIYCSNDGKGCEWQGKLEDLKDHLSLKCNQATVSCPNKCKKSMLRKELNKHMTHSCLLREHKCKYCGIKGTYHSLTGECGDSGSCSIHQDHYETCDAYPLECPNRCKEKRIKRKNMKRHREECLLEPVDCPFKEVGCKIRILRRDLNDHVDESDHHHLTLMMTAFKEMKEKVAELESRTVSLRPLRYDHSKVFTTVEPPCKRMRCCFD